MIPAKRLSPIIEKQKMQTQQPISTPEEARAIAKEAHPDEQTE